MLLKRLCREGIIYSSNYIDCIAKSIWKKDGNSITFFVRIGHFQTYVNILKVHKDSKEFVRKTMSSGAYSKVYVLDIEGRNCVVKSQKIETQDRATLNFRIDEVLRELIFYKIASILRFGPYLEKVLGYDIICYNDSIEFAMELCDDVKEPHSNEFERDLMEGMKKMHSLQIVHRDIKPANVGWSPSFRKWVFLDFGFAKNLQQTIGFKTRSKFIGSYPYATKELQQIHDLGICGWVDFYHNDLHGLKKVLKVLNENLEKE